MPRRSAKRSNRNASHPAREPTDTTTAVNSGVVSTVGELLLRNLKPPLNELATSPMPVAAPTAANATNPRTAAKRGTGGLANRHVVRTTKRTATAIGKRTNANCLGGGNQRIRSRAAATPNPVRRGKAR